MEIGFGALTPSDRDEVLASPDRYCRTGDEIEMPRPE
jgi:hypothetical protein